MAEEKKQQQISHPFKIVQALIDYESQCRALVKASRGAISQCHVKTVMRFVRGYGAPSVVGLRMLNKEVVQSGGMALGVCSGTLPVTESLLALTPGIKRVIATDSLRDLGPPNTDQVLDLRAKSPMKRLTCLPVEMSDAKTAIDTHRDCHTLVMVHPPAIGTVAVDAVRQFAQKYKRGRLAKYKTKARLVIQDTVGSDLDALWSYMDRDECAWTHVDYCDWSRDGGENDEVLVVYSLRS